MLSHDTEAPGDSVVTRSHGTEATRTKKKDQKVLNKQMGRRASGCIVCQFPEVSGSHDKGTPISSRT